MTARRSSTSLVTDETSGNQKLSKNFPHLLGGKLLFKHTTKAIAIGNSTPKRLQQEQHLGSKVLFGCLVRTSTAPMIGGALCFLSCVTMPMFGLRIRIPRGRSLNVLLPVFYARRKTKDAPSEMLLKLLLVTTLEYPALFQLCMQHRL